VSATIGGVHISLGNRTVDTCETDREQITDDEFDAWFEQELVDEQEFVDHQTAGGNTFILSTLGKVHTLECRNSGFTPNRREAWAAFIPGGSRHIWREQLSHGSPPRMPDFVNRLALTGSTTKYVRCQICVPDVPVYVQTPRGPQTLADVYVQMQVSADRYKAKPAKAVVAVLDLHADVDGLCVACHGAYPCPTTQAVRLAFNLPS
jgi:hypothetical protein